MANRKAIATGNWSNPAIWDGGVAVPTSADDVYANGFSVIIDQNVTCLSLRTTSASGIVAGGSFQLPVAFDVTANITPGSTVCLLVTATSGTVNVTGNVVGSGTTNYANGISHGAACDLVVVGTVSGGTFNGQIQAIQSNSLCGNLTVTGNCTGASVGTQHYAINFGPSTAGKTLIVNGNIASRSSAAIVVTGNGLGVTTANITGVVSTAVAGPCIITGGANMALTFTATGGFTAGPGSLGTFSHTSGTGTVNGDLRPGSSGAVFLNCNGSTGNSVVNGDVYGFSGGSSLNTIAGPTSGGTLTINGNVYGATGTASGNCWSVTGSNGAVIVNGDVYGAVVGGVACVNNPGSGTLTVNGTATGGTSTAGPAHGVTNQGTGTCFVRTAKSNDYPNGGNTQQAFGTFQANLSGFITVDSMEDGSGGWPACSGRHFIRAAGVNFCKMRESNAGAITVMGDVPNDYPIPTDVRDSVMYDFGAQSGTLKVPPVGSVALGVPTDNTVGTANLSGVTLAAIEASTILAMKADVTAVPAAVRVNLATELARIDVAVSTRLATAGYTAPANATIATMAAAIATLPADVRAALATELARIDVATSTRLSAAGYTAPLDSGATQSAAAAALTAYDPATTGALVTGVNTLLVQHGATQAAIAGLPAPDNASIAAIKANAGLIPALL